MGSENADWKQTHAAKVVDAAAAIRAIPPGRRILIGSGAAEPVVAGRGAGRARRPPRRQRDRPPADARARALRASPSSQHRFRHTAFFIGAERARGGAGGARRLHAGVPVRDPASSSASRRVRIDVALIQVSPPDAHGYVSLGVSVDIVRAAVDAAELVIAEVNPRMPRTLGDSFVPMSIASTTWSPVDCAAARAATPSRPARSSASIGRHVATLVPDGATLQTGHRRDPRRGARGARAAASDLGVHTEMLSDGVMELAEAGVITGAGKTLLPGKIVTSFVMGSRELYDWVARQPGRRDAPLRLHQRSRWSSRATTG